MNVKISKNCFALISVLLLERFAPFAQQRAYCGSSFLSKCSDSLFNYEYKSGRAARHYVYTFL